MQTEMQIEAWPIEKVRPYENNPRVHDGAVDVVASSIQRFGWRQPLVVDEAGVIVVGHTRLLAAKKLNLKTVPVHVARGLSETEIAAYRLVDNRAAELSGWDKDKLGTELQALAETDLDLAAFGFSEAEMKGLLGSLETAAEEATGRLQEPPDVDDEPAAKPTMKFARTDLECQNYVMVVFSDKERWEEAKQHFKLTGEANGFGGVGRVVDGAKYLDALKKTR